MNDLKISIIEDDKSLLEIMSIILSEKGYKVTGFTNCEDFLEAFKSIKPDIILTDKNLPAKNGFDLIKHIRQENKDLPIFVITGRGNSESNIEAYKIGADDFIKKPFEYDILEAKIQRALEKVKFQMTNDLVFCEDKQEIQKDSKRSSLTASEALILKELLVSKGKLVRREYLKSKNFGNSLDVHISSLRKKLAKLKINVQTVKGKGYYIKRD